MSDCRKGADGSMLATSICPTCKYEMSAATSIEPGKSRQPIPGDISLCLKCGEVLVFNQKLAVEIALLTDMLDMSDQQQALIAKAQRIIREQRYVG
jgi:hypothetical protein